MVFNKTLYPRGRQSIAWSRIRWNCDEQLRKRLHEHRLDIGLTADPQELLRYAVGPTEIVVECEKELNWAHVLGARINDQPVCQQGANLLLSLHKLHQYLENTGSSIKNKTPRPTIRVVIYKRCLSELSEYNLLSWKQYGAPYKPGPERASLRSLLARIPHRRDIGELPFAERPKRLNWTRH